MATKMSRNGAAMAKGRESKTQDEVTPQSETAGPGVWLGFLAMCIGMFMAILDIQIVATSLPAIRAALKISPDQMSWIQTSYLIAEIIAIPMHQPDRAAFPLQVLMFQLFIGPVRDTPASRVAKDEPVWTQLDHRVLTLGGLAVVVPTRPTAHNRLNGPDIQDIRQALALCESRSFTLRKIRQLALPSETGGVASRLCQRMNQQNRLK